MNSTDDDGEDVENEAETDDENDKNTSIANADMRRKSERWEIVLFEHQMKQ